MFGYKCDKCGKGTVLNTKVNKYKTRIDGIPFTVENAVIGVCDHCEEKYFSARETKRWRDLFFQEQLKKGSILTQSEISSTREAMGLSIAEFARLIGCSRQALYLWESPDREAPQSRMADMVIRLVRDSYAVGLVDVIQFLREALLAAGMEPPVCQVPAKKVKKHLTDTPSMFDQPQTEDLSNFDMLYSLSTKPEGFSPRLGII